MESVKLTAEPRPTSGKGPAKRLRGTGKIPAVAYGRNLPSTPIAISPKELADVLRSERGKNTVLELSLPGRDPLSALVVDYQYHPVTRELLHADFRQIRDDELVDVEVPFEATGKAAGIVLGGVLRQVYRFLPIRCLAKDIPLKMSHDITEVGLEDAVTASQLALPAGVQVRLRPEQTVLAVVGDKRPEEEAPAAEGAVAAAPAAAEGAAPAKPAKP